MLLKLSFSFFCIYSPACFQPGFNFKVNSQSSKILLADDKSIRFMCCLLLCLAFSADIGFISAMFLSSNYLELATEDSESQKFKQT